MPTDSDWGRLYNYNTVGDAGLLMPPRSYYFRDFFGGGWNEMLIGMIYRNTGLASDVANLVAERQDESSPANLFHFGISQSANGTIPVANNPNFLGIRGERGGLSQITIAPLQLANVRFASVFNSADQPGGVNMVVPLQQGTSATPFAMIGIRYIFNPTDQKIYVKFAANPALALANDAANVTTLTTFLNSITRDFTAMDAAFGFWDVTKFGTFYIYWPYFNNKLALQTVGAIKVA